MYLHHVFYKELVSLAKWAIIHSRNKKWVTKEMKTCLVQNNTYIIAFYFLQGDKVRLTELLKEFSKKSRLAKKWKSNLHQEMQERDLRT